MIPPHALSSILADGTVWRPPCWCCPSVSIVVDEADNGTVYRFPLVHHDGTWILTAGGTGPPPM